LDDVMKKTSRNSV